MSDEDELQIFLSTSNLLKKSYLDARRIDPWASSPFAWIKTHPSRQIGKIGEQLVTEWCKKKGFDVRRSRDSQCDLIINNKRVEIKFSTLWESGVYTFQQIRNQDYEYAILLGLSPFCAHCWVVPKQLLFNYVIGHTPQHTGKIGTETFWLSFPVKNPPDWLKECGGSLSRANIVLRNEFD